jgi:hypothetical protein
VNTSRWPLPLAGILVLVASLLTACQSSRPNPDLPLDPEFLHADLKYDGPHARFASITESPFWALSTPQLISLAEDRGWKLQGRSRPMTPYGPGPDTLDFRSPSGREVLFIRDYGKTPGGEYRQRQLYERLFWVLWKAGVKSLVIGSHSGSADWRKGPETIVPGDLVFPWSFESKAWFTGLPGTPYETVWNNPMVTRTHELPWPYMRDPFSTPMASFFKTLAEPEVKAGHIGKIVTPAEVRSVLVSEDSIGFESNYDIYARQAIAKTISEMQPERPPIVTLHGSVINPVLAKFLQIDTLPYQIISNPAQGVIQDISKAHDAHVYSREAAEMWLRLELEFFESYPG